MDRVSHPKFVPLVGYCMENRDHKFVVYEYMANGDLFSSLCRNREMTADGQSQPLDWKSRLKVAIGVTQALCHLHHKRVPPLVHRNVKASSILIDKSYDGCLSRVTGACTEKKDGKQNIISKLLRFPRFIREDIKCNLWRLTEIKMLGRLSHPNLIKLHGYCFEDKELVLVYEYMPKGSLHNHLFGRGSNIQPLSWDIRLKVLVGAAQGLPYLHALKREVIFRDFKTSSILLDSFYNPKLSDFGLAKMGPPENDSHVTTCVIGTIGYADPEYVATGHLYVKSDVYGFGVVMVEVLTGLRAMDLIRSVGQQNSVDWIKPHLSDKRQIKKIMDSHLEGKDSVKGAAKMAQLALTCLETEAKNRPSMKQVLETLLGIGSSLESKRIQRTKALSAISLNSWAGTK